MIKINCNREIEAPDRNDDALQVVGIVQVDANRQNWAFPMHSHDDIVDLVLITHGEGYLTTGKNQHFATKKGDLLIHNQDSLHAERTNADNPLEEICISLTGVQINGLPYNHILPAKASPLMKTDDSFHLFYYLFDFIKSICIDQKPGFKLLCQDAAKMVLSLIQYQLSHSYHHHCDPNFPVVMEIVEYLDIHYNRNIKLEDLSDLFHFNSYYLAHKFKEEMGITINQYVTNRRIGEAEKLLVYTDMTITEIARHVGYDNLNHFYATFKKHIGVAPGKLRENYDLK